MLIFTISAQYKVICYTTLLHEIPKIFDNSVVSVKSYERLYADLDMVFTDQI